MSKLRLEPLTFCLCWIALAVAASLLGGTWAGLAVALGLLLVLMPTSAFILSRYEDGGSWRLRGYCWRSG